MVEPVDADLEATSAQLAQNAVIDGIRRRDDVERRTEAALLFEVRQLEREAKNKLRAMLRSQRANLKFSLA